ncbi:S8 family serine peptidase [Micromonospora rubida]|uniref:S8 family serine peptidase n=1 Tax=Micromonospora rubida TaxID=2697657 RepID=A0ABW7SGS4_9ACTN
MTRWKRTARRGSVPALALSLAMAGTVPAAATPQPTGDPSAPRPAAGALPGERTVTLLTGDRVRVRNDSYLVEPGPGRQKVIFQQQRVGDRDYVIPADALGLIGSKQLDRRLFDITTLLEMGYDDRSTGNLPLLVVPGTGTNAAVASAGTGRRVVRELPSVKGRAVHVAKPAAGRFWTEIVRNENPGARSNAPATRVWLDGRRKVSLDRSVPQVGTPGVWQAGYTGRGVKVAVLDTGIDSAHPDFAGRIAETHNFTEDTDTNDVVGHGTHVASTIAGSGAASGGKYKGVAPEATLLAGKVCTWDGCTDSAIMAGMEWAATSGAKVVNLSLGAGDTPEVDPVEEAVNNLTAQHGTLFVIAAGNEGPGAGTVGSPASADAALAVGAVDANDDLARFSSRGPRAGDGAIKPEITAPGVDIVAARAVGSHPDDPVGDSYARMSGTSMATPHVAGAAVLLAQQHADWRSPDLKASLMGAAAANPKLTVYEQGAGRLDVAAASARTVRVEPTTINLGLQRWPHTDDQPVSRTLTYRNSGSAPVTLTLAADVTGPDGKAAPAGMFQVQPSQLTVPAGGTATATLTADTRVSGAEGVYPGSVLATGNGASLRTLLVVDREPESYDLTLTHLDRTGAPTPSYNTILDGVTASGATWPYDPDGTVKVRIPKGRYHLTTVITGESDGSLLTRPELSLTGDTVITLDARVAQRSAGVSVPDPGAQPLGSVVGFYRHLPGGTLSSSSLFSLGGFEPLYTAHLGAALPAAGMRGRVLSWWGEPAAGGGFSQVYNLAWYPPGRLPSGFNRQVQHSELAVVQAKHRIAQTVEKTSQPSLPDYQDTWRGSSLVAPPGDRTEYYTTEGGVRWNSELWGGDIGQESAPTAYPVGEQTERWLAAPFGPGFPAPATHGDLWMSRTGDKMWLIPPMFADGTPTHAGFADRESSRRALYRNGVAVPLNEGECDVPPGPASYRFEAEDNRVAGAELSTRVSATWTFRSAHVSGDKAQHLPVMAVRAAPELDAQDAAPAGQRFRFPVTVQRQTGAPGGTVVGLTLDISYDGGKTWQPVRLVRNGNTWTATVDHPAGSGFASLRAFAVDSAGNTVRQTIVNAYRLRG